MALSTLAVIVMAAGAIVARELLGVRPSGTGPVWVPVADGQGAAPSAAITADGDVLAPIPADVAPGIGRDAGREPVIAGGLPSGYDCESLIARLSRATPHGRGRRVLVTAPSRADRAAAIAQELGAILSRTKRALLLKVDLREAEADRPGLTDLVAGEASFFEIIERDARSRLHVVDAGSHDAALLVEEPQAIAIAFEAFDQTYDWVVCLLCDPGERPLVSLLAQHVDAAVIVSNDDPASESLVALYDLMKASGAPDVVVAREVGWPEAPAVAAA